MIPKDNFTMERNADKERRRGEKNIQIAIILCSIIHEKYCERSEHTYILQFHALFIAMKRCQNIDLRQYWEKDEKKNALTRK